MKIFLNEQMHLNGEDWTSGNPEEISNNLTELLKILNIFNYHLDVELYYSSDGIFRLLENFNVLDSLTDYQLTNPITQLRTVLMSINAVDWTTSIKHKNDFFYFYQTNRGGGMPHYINGTTVAEACEYKFENNVVALVNLISSEYNLEQPIHIVRSRMMPPPLMNIVSLDTTTNKAETVQFIKKERTQRNFNLIEKHGENLEVGRWWRGEWASPLKCSGREAQALLNNAVAMNGEKDLFGYDPVRKEFVVFKYENNTPANQYHGYYPERENDAIPIEVKNFLLD